MRIRAVIGALLLAAASPATPAAAQTAPEAKTIVVYNAQHEGLTQAWVDAFTRDTGIKVVLRKGSDMALANQILQEGTSSPADVFLTENSPAMALVDNAGLFAPLAADTLAQIPQQFRSSQGRWIGVAARSTVFAYNKSKLTPEQLPKTLASLAGAEWKGRWAASPSGADFQAIVGAYLELNSADKTAQWLKAMKENVKQYKGNGVAMKAVNAGEADGAVIYHYYAFRDQAKTGENSQNITLHYFRNGDAGAFLSVSGAGVLASSKQRPEAEAFVKWLSGTGGQTVVRTGDTFDYAVGVGAASHPKLEPLDKLQAPKIEPSKLNSKAVVELMTAAGLL